MTVASTHGGATLSLETPRLLLREATLSDGSFLLRLLNEPSWLENIGDRGVRSRDDAEGYIKDNIWSSYREYGYGMYVVELRATTVPIGLCGLVRRDFLSTPDLGFALLPDHVGHGYATEAARALLRHSQSKLGIGVLCAIAKRNNHRSVRVLERLGFRHEGPILLPEGAEVELFARP